MRAIAFISFDGFYAASLLRQNQAWAAKPLVVLKARKVLDADPQAQKAGIHPGMTAQEARYAARGSLIPPIFQEFKEELFLPCSRRWLDVAKQFAASVEPVESHQAFLDLGQLAGARNLVFQLSADLYSAIKLCPRIGIAETMLTARIAADNNEIINPGEDERFLAPLPIERLWPADPVVIKRLRYLGYKTIGEAARLPRDVLRRQFGDEGDRMAEWCRGKDHRTIRSLYPQDELYARFSFPQPARLDGEIEPALHKLSQTLALQLAQRDRQAAEIELEILFDDDLRRAARREFLHPMQSAGSLLTGLRLTLRKISIDREVHSINARLLQIKKPDQKQSDLNNSHKEQQLAEMVKKRLQENLGETVIKKASEIETPRRELLLRAWKQATGWNG